MIARLTEKTSFPVAIAAALLAGALSAFAMPPLGLFPVLFVTLPALLYLNSRAQGMRQAFLTGWAFGVGYFAVTLHWLSTAFQMFFDSYAAFRPLILVIIPCYIAAYYGLACLLAWRWRGDKTSYVLIFSAALFWAEYLRGDYLTHFPWSTLGYAWHHVISVLQVTSVAGIAGLTLLTILWSTFLYAPARIKAALIISFFIVTGWGWQRLQMPDSTLNYAVRLVQPNIPQMNKDNYGKEQENVNTLLSLTRRETFMDESIDAVIWPETALDIFTHAQTSRLKDIPAALPAGTTYAIFGVNRPGDLGKMHNSVISMDRNGTTIDTHDKFILAPWGESIPYPEIVKRTPLYRMVDESSVMAAGPGPRSVRLPGFPAFSPIICFESTFSGKMTDPADRPDVLVFITNDAWSFGTDGPQQHLGFARVRAIEEGLPILRAANTGLTSVIDSYGRIKEILPENTQGVIDAKIPEALPPTPFSAYKNLPAVLLSGILFLLGLIRKKI